MSLKSVGRSHNDIYTQQIYSAKIRQEEKNVIISGSIMSSVSFVLYCIDV